MIYIAPISLKESGRVHFALHFTSLGVRQQSVYETKIHDIDDL